MNSKEKSENPSLVYFTAIRKETVDGQLHLQHGMLIRLHTVSRNAFIVTEKSAKIDGANGLKKNMDEKHSFTVTCDILCKAGMI